MAIAISYAMREQIVNRRLMGQSLRAISLALLISLSVAKKWWGRFRTHGKGALAVKKATPPHGGAMSRFNPILRQEALLMKKARPHWSAARILRELSLDRRVDGLRLPSARTLNRFFAQNAQFWQPLEGHTFQSPDGWEPTWGAHVEWQLDLKEDVRIDGIGVVSFVNIYDIGSGIMILSYPFVVGSSGSDGGGQKLGRRDLSWKDIRCALREAFSHWGFPLRVRTDRGMQFIGSERGVMPSLFSLWLVGLGIEHRLNEKPYSPQLNGGVERMHRTLGDRVWKGAHFDSPQSLRAALWEEIQWLNPRQSRHARASYKQIPLVAHPQAAHSGRYYSTDIEADLFESTRVWQYLAAQVPLTRRVGKTGQVSINDLSYCVGRQFCGREVSVKVDREKAEYVFLIEGAQVKRQAMRGFCPEDLISDNAPISRRRSHGKKNKKDV